jgi:hypothetical protein
MAELGMTRQVDLVRASDLSDSTISRVIYQEGYAPDRKSAADLARGLRVKESERDDFVLFVLRAGATPAPTLTADEQEPILAEANLMLRADSSLTDEERDDLRRMLNLVVESKRQAMRRRSTQAS